ncbi:MAG: hypothetical protein EXS13_05610 [Planctomycetes bacterium]|nr:hypothetical protein [Planctomycetota bacterium]
MSAERPSDDHSASAPPAQVEALAFEAQHDADVPAELLSKRICDFDLHIEGRPLEKVIERFRDEIAARGMSHVRPVFYLSDIWGVTEGTVAIGIPFYLADDALRRVQKQRGGVVEGETEEEILRYLRHEMGHVVNYAYRLYTSEEWTTVFGPMSRPYVEDYKVAPFSTDFVRHLPGGYAQKHPDEDWAETFAVWMTDQLDWRELYVDSAGALAKLEYCARTMKELRDRAPEVINSVIDYEAKDIHTTVQEFYASFAIGDVIVPKSLDGDLQVIFARTKPDIADSATARTGDAALLMRRQRDFLANSVYRWTGVDTSVIQPVLTHLIARSTALKLTYPLSVRDEVLVEISGFLTTLAMNFVYKGKFIGS